jgi:DNA-binding transcriptional LysR family regulator
MLDPRRLLTFREVAHQRSFSGAAAALALTQPAVSQQVRALELAAGVRLLERGAGRFELTPAGALVLAHADALAARLQLAETQLAEQVASGQRTLRLSAFASALATIVPAAIGVLRDRDPDLRIDVRQASTDELAAALADGTLHAGITFQDARTPRHEPPGLVRYDLLDEPFVAVVGPGHPLAGAAEAKLSALRGERFTAPSRAGLVVGGCRRAGFEPDVAYLTGDPLAIAGIVASGLAVALTPRLLAPLLRGVHIVPLRGEPVRRSVYVLAPEVAPHRLLAVLLEALRPA